MDVDDLVLHFLKHLHLLIEQAHYVNERSLRDALLLDAFVIVDTLLNLLINLEVCDLRGVLELLLPRVAAVPYEDILDLRRDNAESFTHFQNKLVDFIRRSDAATSEASLVDLLLHIDEEITRLRSEFERLDSRKSLEKMGLMYSFGVMSLVLLLPTEIFKSFAALLGSTSSLKALRNIRLLDIERRALADDPFYLPYRLSTMARDLSSSY